MDLAGAGQNGAPYRLGGAVRHLRGCPVLTLVILILAILMMLAPWLGED